MNANQIECPDCGGHKALAPQTEVGQLLSCADCGARLEVLSLIPMQIGHAPQIEEDFGE